MSKMKNKSVIFALVKGFKIRPIFVSVVLISVIVAFIIVWNLNQNVFMFLLALLVLKSLIDIVKEFKK